MGDATARRWIAPVLLAALAVGAFWDGLYAPAQQLVAVGLAALLVLAVRRGVRLSAAEGAAALLLAVGSGISLAAPAAAGAAAHGPAVVTGWLLSLAGGRALSGSDRPLRLLGRLWPVLATLMAFGGMAAISFTPAHHSGRLASFLGYPIAVGMLGLLGLAGSIPDLAEGRTGAVVLTLGSGLGVVLSGSRGVWAAGAALVLYLAWAAPGLLRRAWPRAAIALGIALAAGLWAAPAVARREQTALWLIAAIALLTAQTLDRFRTCRPLLAAATLSGAVALALAPGWPWFLGRATALPGTEGASVERLTFLKDGWSLVTGLPWGAGYRAWNALHLQAASYGYYSAEVHSAPLDLALAFGWAGGLGFVLILARFLWQLRMGRIWSPWRLATLAGLGALALHALVDWDLTYGLFSFPLWFGFGLAGEPDRGPVAWPGWLTVGLASVALAALALLGAGDFFTARAGASLAAGAPEAALRHARAATALSPWNDLAYAYLGDAQGRLGLSDQAAVSLERARRLGPREPWYARMSARLLAAEGRWREAAAAWRESVRLWPWHVPAYEEALQGHIELIGRARASGQEALARELAESGDAILAALLQQKAREPEKAPRKPMQIDTPPIRQARQVIAQALSGAER